MEFQTFVAMQHKTIGKFLIAYAVGNFFKYLPDSVYGIIQFPLTSDCPTGGCECSRPAVFKLYGNEYCSRTAGYVNYPYLSVIV